MDQKRFKDVRRLVNRAAYDRLPWRTIAATLEDETDAAKAHADASNEPDEDE